MANGRKLAVCDPPAFYHPFRRLVEGPLTDPQDLEAAERFIRTVVLHDELIMGIEPLRYRAEDYEGSEAGAIRREGFSFVCCCWRAASAPGRTAGVLLMFPESSFPGGQIWVRFVSRQFKGSASTDGRAFTQPVGSGLSLFQRRGVEPFLYKSFTLPAASIRRCERRRQCPM